MASPQTLERDDLRPADDGPAGPAPAAAGRHGARFLGPSERAVLSALAEAAVPAGRLLAEPDARFLDETERLLGRGGSAGRRACRALLWAIELGSLAAAGSRFSRIASRDERERLLGRWAGSGAGFWALYPLLAPLKVARLDDGRLHDLLGCRYVAPPAVDEPARWRERILDLTDEEGDREIEVDAVVVGTGAGGAPVAHALASAGDAVLMLEEGGYFSRKDFTGRPLDLQRRLYRAQGFTIAVGNTAIPIPVGMAVGGTTAINSGTCYRVPERVLARWSGELGLTELTAEALAPEFEKVERMLRVEEARPEHLGGCARVVARGCEKLGWAHRPLRRNAPDCDGQGVCCFGCPTGAKRSTDVSYVPEALRAGAMLYTHARVERILCEAGRAVGVVARATSRSGRPIELTVRARVVVLACGTLLTPLLLLRNGLANRSGMVGRNLSIHPAAHAAALFDERIEGWKAIPQGYAIEEFRDQGLLFEGGFLPLEVSGAALSAIGRRWTGLVESFDRLAVFGFMVEDRSRGRVRPGPRGAPLITYWLERRDRELLVRGQAILARVFLAAGARSVHPGLRGVEPLTCEADVARLESEGPRRLRARHFDLSAYHPLGTCRMGVDPATSVVDPTHETHGVRNLFVCDGSAVPSSIGVNPQLTIMALAERASRFIHDRIAGEG